MTTETTRRALFGGAGLVALAATVPTFAQPGNPDRAAWDAAIAKWKAALKRDEAINLRCDKVTASGDAWTDADEREWSASIEHVLDMEEAVFDLPAPDLAALEWKVQNLIERERLNDSWAEPLLADIKRLSSMEGR